MIWWGFFSVSCLPRRSRQAKTDHLFSVFRHLSSVICHLSSDICHLFSDICHLFSDICHLFCT